MKQLSPSPSGDGRCCATVLFIHKLFAGRDVSLSRLLQSFVSCLLKEVQQWGTMSLELLVPLSKQFGSWFKNTFSVCQRPACRLTLTKSSLEKNACLRCKYKCLRGQVSVLGVRPAHRLPHPPLAHPPSCLLCCCVSAQLVRWKWCEHQVWDEQNEGGLWVTQPSPALHQDELWMWSTLGDIAFYLSAWSGLSKTVTTEITSSSPPTHPLLTKTTLLFVSHYFTFKFT